MLSSPHTCKHIRAEGDNALQVMQGASTKETLPVGTAGAASACSLAGIHTVQASSHALRGMKNSSLCRPRQLAVAQINWSFSRTCNTCNTGAEKPTRFSASNSLHSQRGNTGPPGQAEHCGSPTMRYNISCNARVV
eukprot:TRINITY_DN27154_c0_g2_i1.p1 TRINITY_DN27154_c0_g2~~TRINITY_DN27154_c0_g2_i1.p1  ORF type:complete len:136 (-),score=4.98 TRINITY_DN27154_c0_g2_i1:333-740(-)